MGSAFGTAQRNSRGEFRIDNLRRLPARSSKWVEPVHPSGLPQQRRAGAAVVRIGHVCPTTRREVTWRGVPACPLTAARLNVGALRSELLAGHLAQTSFAWSRSAGYSRSAIPMGRGLRCRHCSKGYLRQCWGLR